MVGFIFIFLYYYYYYYYYYFFFAFGTRECNTMWSAAYIVK